MTVLECRDLRSRYGDGDEILRGMTFSMNRGEVVGLLGRNGAGKTTLIRLAMGMLTPAAGVMKTLGVDPRKDPMEVKSRVGYVAEEQILPPFMRGHEVLSLHQSLFSSWNEDRVRELCGEFEIPLGLRVSQMSKGQARQLALLCAMAHDPELLILDEPAGGLDPSARRLFLETSIRVLNDQGTAILFSSHYMSDVERMADRIVLLHDGQAFLDSPLDDVRERFCLLIAPWDSAAASRLEQEASCLSLRRAQDKLRAIVSLDREKAESWLSQQGLSGFRCSRLNLEEMFIELARRSPCNEH